MRSVPYSIPSLYAGFGECHGVLHDDGEALRFEYQVRDKLGGLIKGKVKTSRVPVDQIVSVQLTKGWLGATWLGVASGEGRASFWIRAGSSNEISLRTLCFLYCRRRRCSSTTLLRATVARKATSSCDD